MSSRSPLWIREAEVVELIDLPAAIGALEAGLRLQAEGRAGNMAKTHLAGPDWQMHAIGASFDDPGVCCAKTWVHSPAGATPLLLMWDTASGNLLAVIEAFALGQMRTGGISGVATRSMAAADANHLALIGTGKQALAQLAAVAAVRRLKIVSIWGRDADRQQLFANAVRGLGQDFEVRTPRTVAEATSEASIVTLVTRAREPIFSAAMARPGAHVNAVGAITPEREEFMQDIFERTDLIAADDPQAASRLSAEFAAYGASDRAGRVSVSPLCDLVARGRARTTGMDLTVFKAMGMGVSDLSLAVEIFKRASDAGAGRSFDHPARVRPRLV